MKKVLLVFICLTLTMKIFSTELSLWYGWEGEEKKIMLGLISKYEKISGNKVKLKRIPFHALNSSYKAYTLKDKGPDLVLGPSDWIGQFEPFSVIEPIDQYVSESEKNKFLKNVLESCKYDGKLYGLPESYKLMALIYNKDIIKTPPKTTNEMIKIGKEFTDKDLGKYGLVYRFASFYTYNVWYGGFGGKIFDENNNLQFNNQAHKNTLNFIKKLRDEEEGIVQEDSYQDIIMSLFKSGNAPMMINGSWILSELMESGVNFGVANIPLINESGKWAKPFVGAEILMLSSRSKNKESAIDLMKYMVSAGVQKETIKIGHIPSLKEVYDYKDFKEMEMYKYVEKFREQAEHATPLPNKPEMGAAAWNGGLRLLEMVLFEEKDIDEAMKEVQEMVDKKIEEFRKKQIQ